MALIRVAKLYFLRSTLKFYNNYRWQILNPTTHSGSHPAIAEVLTCITYIICAKSFGCMKGVNTNILRRTP